eukprot:12937099-Prorocentrum_lima.AAC.1
MSHPFLHVRFSPLSATRGTMCVEYVHINMGPKRQAEAEPKGPPAAKAKEANAELPDGEKDSTNLPFIEE